MSFSVFALICFALSSDFCIVYWFVAMRWVGGVSNFTDTKRGSLKMFNPASRGPPIFLDNR